ncbi:MAG: metal-dependent hydrolase [Fluviicoccus sp.]|uniref:metal-dependent hydrolase n=1 Tax=Fluviicoccus sp. TaxID=2003552 RepID=UPI0027214433|nr:metal-dependent hydrolase [Fluviicoccus sp.]MDO8329219.1 metal-dependent hydrolase [Fluviicoccus sp.]
MNMNAKHTRSTPIALEVRKETRFDFSTVPAIHTEDNLYISHLFNALSLIAPITEGMLIRAIRDAQPLLQGSVLAADAQAFIGQEAIHTREHREFNRRLGELGFSIEKMSEVMESITKKNESTMSLKQRLAVVVTGEHVIYSLSRAFLAADLKGFQQHPEVTRLLKWHALEEMEHQSVCHDIYTHLYGNSVANQLVYNLTFVGINRSLYQGVAQLMKALLAQDRAPRKGEFLAFLRWMLRDPAIGKDIARELLAYFSPVFMHWRRSNDDQRLIRENLDFVYQMPPESARNLYAV